MQTSAKNCMKVWVSQITFQGYIQATHSKLSVFNNFLFIDGPSSSFGIKKHSAFQSRIWSFGSKISKGHCMYTKRWGIIIILFYCQELGEKGVIALAYMEKPINEDHVPVSMHEICQWIPSFLHKLLVFPLKNCGYRNAWTRRKVKFQAYSWIKRTRSEDKNLSPCLSWLKSENLCWCYLEIKTISSKLSTEKNGRVFPEELPWGIIQEVPFVILFHTKFTINLVQTSLDVWQGFQSGDSYFISTISYFQRPKPNSKLIFPTCQGQLRGN